MDTNRKAYSLDQLRACLFAAELRYELAGSCYGAAMWLRSIHQLRDRISHAEFMEKMK